MPAITKKELLTLSEKEYTKLNKLIAVIPNDAALVKDEEDTSIKDVIGHRAHWIDLFLVWQSDGVAGKTVHFPADGYKWNELKRYNADLREQQADLDWYAARSMLDDRYKQLMDRIQSLSEKDLYGGPMPGANNNWTTGRWAEASGPSHFRSAGKYIRARLRAAA